MSDETFLTTDELIEYLQVNLRTIYRLIKAGKIPATRVGRQWRFRKRDIDAWLENQRTAAARSVPAPSGSSLKKPVQVLVVDDEESIRQVLAGLLIARGLSVDLAPDGSTALARLRARTYDLLIVDLLMPGMDGLSVIRAARQTAPGLPAIVITGHSTEERAIEAANLGVSGYLTKPFAPAQVFGAVDRALAKIP